MAVGLVVMTCLFRFPFARPPFVAMGLMVAIAFLATVDGRRLPHGCFSGYIEFEYPNPYRTKQAILVILLGIAYVRRRAVTHPALRSLILTSAAAVMVTTLFMLIAAPPAQLTFCAMTYGASAVLALGVAVSRHLASSPLPEAIVRQPDTARRSEQR